MKPVVCGYNLTNLKMKKKTIQSIRHTNKTKLNLNYLIAL